MKKLLMLLIAAVLAGPLHSKDIRGYFEAATTDKTFLSHFELSLKAKLSYHELQEWIQKNRSYFSSIDSIKVSKSDFWQYGSSRSVVTKVVFIKESNRIARKNYFEEIARQIEAARLAEIKRQDEIRRKEQERLEAIKKSIENRTFTGEHFYEYPEGKYVGTFVNGKREGYGELFFKQGGYYKGEFKDDYFHGYGEERIIKKGDFVGLRLQGKYLYGKRDGIFIVYKGTWLTGNDEWEITFDHGKLVSTTTVSSEFSDFISDMSSSSSYSTSSSQNSSSTSESSQNTKEIENVRSDVHVEFREYETLDCNNGVKQTYYRVYKNGELNHNNSKIGVVSYNGYWSSNCPGGGFLPDKVEQSKMTLKQFLIRRYESGASKADSYNLITK